MFTSNNYTVNMSPFLKCLVCTVIQNVHFLTVGLSYLHKNQAQEKSNCQMSVFHSFTKSSISKCPSFTVSQKVQFPNVLLSYFLEMSLFQMSYCHSCMKSSSFSNFRLHFWTKRPFTNVRYFPNVLLP